MLGLSVALVQPTAAAAPAAAASGQTLSEARAEATALRASLVDLRARSARSIVLLEQAEDQLGQAVTRSVALSRELDEARAAARGTDAQLDRRVAALYRSGGAIGLWTTLLDARTPYELASRKANVDAVVSADARLRSTAAQGSGRLAELEAQAREGAAERTRLAQAAEAQAAELAGSQQQQQALLDGATERVRVLVEEQRRAAAAEAARRLAAQQAQARAEALAAQQRAVETALAAGLPPPSGGGAPSSGSLPFSVGTAYAGPAGVCPVGQAHDFTDTWHAPRSGGRKHQGTDVFAPYGSPAYAVVDGVVDKWSDSGLGGIALWLRGDNGDRYYYAHNVANIARVGQRVRAGEQIAYVGTTGNAATTPPHIHFEAHAGGGPATNPYPWLAALCAG